MINPKNLSHEQILQKWGELVKIQCKLTNNEDVKKVSEFAHDFALSESIKNHKNQDIETAEDIFKISNEDRSSSHFIYNDFLKSLLPLNLKVISKISDLSNVTFMNAPICVDVQVIRDVDADGVVILRKKENVIQVGTSQHKIKVEKDLLANHIFKNSVIDKIEEIIAEMISKTINDKISRNYKVYLYRPIQNINGNMDKLITADNSDVNNTVDDKTQYITFKIYSRWAFVTYNADETNIADNNIK